MGKRRLQATEEGWGPPFPEDEYRQRVDKVILEMARREIDLLFVSSPPNITYLTGYDLVWYYLTSPTGVAIHAGSGSSLFFEAAYHRPTVEYHAVVDDAVYFPPGGFPDHAVADDSISLQPEGSPVATIVETLKSRGWLKGTVGLETWSRSPNGNILAELESSLAEAGASVCDGSWAVDRVRLVKSPREVDVVRKAAAIADIGMDAVRDAIQPGVAETELQGVILHAMMKEGGGDPAIRVAVRSGPRFAAWHCVPSHRKVELGDLVWINFCGVYHRYHTDLGRLFSVGEPDPRWRDLMRKATGSLDHVVRAVKPGDPITSARTAADEYIDSMGLSKYAGFIGGYDLGISIPPPTGWVIRG